MLGYRVLRPIDRPCLSHARQTLGSSELRCNWWVAGRGWMQLCKIFRNRCSDYCRALHRCWWHCTKKMLSRSLVRNGSASSNPRIGNRDGHGSRGLATGISSRCKVFPFKIRFPCSAAADGAAPPARHEHKTFAITSSERGAPTRTFTINKTVSRCVALHP